MAKMTKNNSKKGKKGMSTSTAVEIGAGVLAAAAAAGAGYYFYGADNAKKHRAAASKWTKDMKNDVVREAKKLKKMDQKTMAAVVDKAAAAYQGVRSVDAADVRAAAAELKKNWKEVQREISTKGNALVKRAQSASTTAKKAVKKAANKTAKKVVKKTAAKKTVAKKTAKKAVKKAAKKRA